jgi:hypothetical protein
MPMSRSRLRSIANPASVALAGRVGNADRQDFEVALSRIASRGDVVCLGFLGHHAANPGHAHATPPTENWLRFPASIPRSFALNPNLAATNSPTNLASF